MRRRAPLRAAARRIRRSTTGRALARMGPHHQDDRRPVQVGDPARSHIEGGGRFTGHPVIDVLRAHHLPGQALEEVGLLVGQAAAADEAHPLGSLGGQHLLEAAHHPPEGLLPAGGDQGAPGRPQGADQGLGDPFGRLDEAVVEPPPVAEPTVIDGLKGAAHHPLEPGPLHVGPEVKLDMAAHGAAVADLIHPDQVPGPGPEAVELGGEGPHGAELDGVAGEDRGVGHPLGSGDEGLMGPLAHHQGPLLGHLVVEAGASPAEDAPLLVQDDERPQVHRLGLAHLGVGQPAQGGPVLVGQVLEITLARPYRKQGSRGGG